MPRIGAASSPPLSSPGPKTNLFYMTRGRFRRKREQRNAQTIDTNSKGEHAALNEDNFKDKSRMGINQSENSRWLRIRDWFGRNKSFADWSIAFFTLVLAAVAIYQYIIMGRQLDVMRNDERAWLTVTSTTPGTVTIGAAPEYTFIINNTGKTPALHVRGDFYIEVIPNGSQPHFESKDFHAVMTTGMIAPNAPQQIPAFRHKVASNDPDPLLQSEKEALDSGKAWIALHGAIGYDDVFKTRHYIKFCTWAVLHPGSYSSPSCVEYNQIDDK
jgi:hypothetical protein